MEIDNEKKCLCNLCSAPVTVENRPYASGESQAKIHPSVFCQRITEMKDYMELEDIEQVKLLCVIIEQMIPVYCSFYNSCTMTNDEIIRLTKTCEGDIKKIITSVSKDTKERLNEEQEEYVTRNEKIKNNGMASLKSLTKSTIKSGSAVLLKTSAVEKLLIQLENRVNNAHT